MSAEERCLISRLCDFKMSAELSVTEIITEVNVDGLVMPGNHGNRLIASLLLQVFFLVGLILERQGASLVRLPLKSAIKCTNVGLCSVLPHYIPLSTSFPVQARLKSRGSKKLELGLPRSPPKSSEWMTGVKRGFNQAINPKLRLEGEAGRQASNPRRKRMKRLRGRDATWSRAENR